MLPAVRTAHEMYSSGSLEREFGRLVKDAGPTTNTPGDVFSRRSLRFYLSRLDLRHCRAAKRGAYFSNVNIVQCQIGRPTVKITLALAEYCIQDDTRVLVCRQLPCCNGPSVCDLCSHLDGSTVEDGTLDASSRGKGVRDVERHRRNVEI